MKELGLPSCFCDFAVSIQAFLVILSLVCTCRSIPASRDPLTSSVPQSKTATDDEQQKRVFFVFISEFSTFYP